MEDTLIDRGFMEVDGGWTALEGLFEASRSRGKRRLKA
jgi:hypothetical protein